MKGGEGEDCPSSRGRSASAALTGHWQTQTEHLDAVKGLRPAGTNGRYSRPSTPPSHGTLNKASSLHFHTLLCMKDLDLASSSFGTVADTSSRNGVSEETLCIDI